VKKWEPVLTGTRFEALTDHAPLAHLKSQRDLSPRQIRWNETLARFDMDICYISSVTNSAADALSHYPHVQPPEMNPATPEELVEVCLITAAAEVDSDIINAIKTAYPDNRLFGPVIANPERYPAYTIQDGLIYHNERLCIPSDRTLPETLLAPYHNDQNHFGTSKTQGNLRRNFLWPGITNDVETYVRSCDSCAWNKSSTQAPAGFLHPLPVPMNRFHEIAPRFRWTPP